MPSLRAVRCRLPAALAALAALALLAGYGDLVRGGITAGAVALVGAYAVLIPAAIVAVPRGPEPMKKMAL